MLTRRDIVPALLASLTIPSVAKATTYNPPVCKCNCKDGKTGPIGPQGPKGEKGEPGECKCNSAKPFSVHFDAEYRVGNFTLPMPDLQIAMPGEKYNDILWYWERYEAMAYFDFNRVTPHVIIFRRGGEANWKFITPIAPGVLSYVGLNAANNAAHHCIVDIKRTIDKAYSNGGIYLDWTPLENFTTFGSISMPY